LYFSLRKFQKNLYFAYTTVNDNLKLILAFYILKNIEYVPIHFVQFCFLMYLSSPVQYIRIWYETGILMPPPTIDYYCYSESVRTIVLCICIYFVHTYMIILQYSTFRIPKSMSSRTVTRRMSSNIMTRWFHTHFFSPVKTRCNTLDRRRLGNT